LVADTQNQTGVLATFFNLGRTCQHHHHWRHPLLDTHPVAVGYICLSTGAQGAYFHEHPDLGTANTGIRGQKSRTHTLQAMSLDPAYSTGQCMNHTAACQCQQAYDKCR